MVSNRMDGVDADQFKSRMHSLAYGNAMLAAAKDYQREAMQASKAAQGQGRGREVDMEELLDDPELQALHAERLARMQQEAEKRQQQERAGHGDLQLVEEGDFLEIVTKTPRVVCHFCHRDFERCKIMDRHLEVLARKYFDTRFIRLSAPDAPFFTVKLQVVMLPCVVMFINGVAVERTVGFDDYGARDDFTTSAVEKRLLKAEVIEPPKPCEEDRLEAELMRRSVRRGSQHRSASDEDSDFD